MYLLSVLLIHSSSGKIWICICTDVHMCHAC